MLRADAHSLAESVSISPVRRQSLSACQPTNTITHSNTKSNKYGVRSPQGKGSCVEERVDRAKAAVSTRSSVCWWRGMQMLGAYPDVGHGLLMRRRCLE